MDRIYLEAVLQVTFSLRQCSLSEAKKQHSCRSTTRMVFCRGVKAREGTNSRKDSATLSL